MFSKLKQIKDLRQQAKEMQTTLGAETAEGSAEWGKIKVLMNGNLEIISVTIDQSLAGNKTQIEAGVKTAANDAIKKVQRVMMGKMKEMGKMPDIFGK